MEQKFYNTEELAQILKQSEDTVEEWIDKGKINAIKFGRMWRIQEQDLSEFINPKTNE